MEQYGKACKSIEKAWKSMGNLRFPMLFHAFACFSMLSHTVPCLFMRFHSFPCFPNFSMLFHAFLCFSTLFHAFPCFPMLFLYFFMLFHAFPCGGGFRHRNPSHDKGGGGVNPSLPFVMTRVPVSKASPVWESMEKHEEV